MNSASGKECDRLRERLPEYADGSLTGPDSARIERHLADCARCSAELRDLQTVIRAVRSVTPEEVPEDLLPRLRRAVRERVPAPVGLPRFWPRIVVPAALAVGVVAVSFALFSPRRLTSGERTAAGRVGAEAPAGVTAAARLPTEGLAQQDSIAVATRPDSEMPTDGLSFPFPPSSGDADRLSQPPASAGPSRRLSALAPSVSDTAAGPPGIAAPAAPAIEEKERAATGGRASTELWAAKTEGLHGGRGGGGAMRGGSGRAAYRGTRAGGGERAEAADVLPPDEQFARPYRARPAQKAQMPCLFDRAEPGAAEIGEAEAPALPFSAKATLVRHRGRPAIALQLAAEGPAQGIAVRVGKPGTSVLIWDGLAPVSEPIVLSAETLGIEPGAIPVFLESPAGRKEYVLFMPALARLGESAPSAPTGDYRGEPLSQVLVEFTALTGLVVLAEEPLDEKLCGSKPEGPPDVALQEIASRAGLDVEQTDGIVFTLTHPR